MLLVNYSFVDYSPWGNSTGPTSQQTLYKFAGWIIIGLLGQFNFNLYFLFNHNVIQSSAIKLFENSKKYQPSETSKFVGNDKKYPTWQTSKFVKNDKKYPTFELTEEAVGLDFSAVIFSSLTSELSATFTSV